MKKFIFFMFLISSSFIFAEVADISFILKGGYSPFGIYGEPLEGTTEDTIYLRQSVNVKAEFHSRSKTFDSLYWGAGIGYIGQGTLDEELGGTTNLNVDYYPIYLLLHIQYPSHHYYDWDMFFAFRGGLAYAKDKGRLSSNSNIKDPLEVPSPYFGFGFGFERNNFILEFFYDLNAGATVDKYYDSNDDDVDFLTLWSHRFGVNVGYRFNSSWVY